MICAVRRDHLTGYMTLKHAERLYNLAWDNISLVNPIQFSESYTSDNSLY